MIRTLGGMALAAGLTAAAVQAAPADHYSTADLTKMMAALKTQAAQSGVASTTLVKYNGDFTMLAYRNRSGGGELHAQYADFFYVVRGRARLITEGKMIDPKEESPGETRGSGVEGGTAMDLKPGDIVHILPGTPHQLLLPKGGEFLYFVVKVKEHE